MLIILHLVTGPKSLFQVSFNTNTGIENKGGEVKTTQPRDIYDIDRSQDIDRAMEERVQSGTSS